jgi:hypothetical protein
VIIPLHVYQDLVDKCRGDDPTRKLPSALCSLWISTYGTQFPGAQVVLVSLGGHDSSQTYLFDIERGRIVAAFGVPVYVAGKRDAGRQSGHPNSDGPRYVKGHLIAHSLGGGMDINVIPQLRRMNGGEFRKLENRAKELAKDGVRALYLCAAIMVTTQVKSRTRWSNASSNRHAWCDILRKRIHRVLISGHALCVARRSAARRESRRMDACTWLKS